MTLEEIIKLHKTSIFHKKDVENSSLCGCFHCSKIFNPRKIVEWTDNGETAICPYCGIDSVIPNVKNNTETKEVLNMMLKYYF